jgi:ribokinase
VVLNAAPARTLSPDLLALVDILIVNEGELRSLSPGASSISLAMQALPCKAVVVTLGPQGSAARFGTQWFFQPGFAVDAVDTTGAGDTFCGMLVAQLSLGAGPAQALQLANAAAALACTAMGAQASVPTRAAVAAFMQSQGPANTDGEHRLRDACQQATA